MSDPTTPPPRTGWQETQWASERPANAAQAPTGALERFMGGSPGVVLLRLLVISVAVGALMMWLDIRPFDIFYTIERMFYRVWRMGFAAVREVLDYIIAGAILVIPIWLVARLLKMTK